MTSTLVGLSSAWMADAACLEHPEIDFFDPSQSARAVTVCAGCLVRRECLAYAFATGARHGVWGGLAPGQRVALRYGGG